MKSTLKSNDIFRRSWVPTMKLKRAISSLKKYHFSTGEYLVMVKKNGCEKVWWADGNTQWDVLSS